MCKSHKIQIILTASLQIEGICLIHSIKLVQKQEKHPLGTYLPHINIAYYDDCWFKVAPTLGFWNKNEKTAVVSKVDEQRPSGLRDSALQLSW